MHPAVLEFALKCLLAAHQYSYSHCPRLPIIGQIQVELMDDLMARHRESYTACNGKILNLWKFWHTIRISSQESGPTPILLFHPIGILSATMPVQIRILIALEGR